MDELMKTTEFLDVHSGSLTFLVTAIYVVATIFICWANISSAKATREQVAESKRQFDEENRAFITYSFLYDRKCFYGIRLTNSGKKTASKIKIFISQDFINSISEPTFVDELRSLDGKEIVLGIGQNYDFYFGSNEYRNNENKVPFIADVHYSDESAEYTLPIYIDTAHYARMYSVNTKEDDFLKALKSLEKELSAISGELRHMNQPKEEEQTDV